jgi:hypothetical protein
MVVPYKIIKFSGVNFSIFVFWQFEKNMLEIVVENGIKKLVCQSRFLNRAYNYECTKKQGLIPFIFQHRLKTCIFFQ